MAVRAETGVEKFEPKQPRCRAHQMRMQYNAAEMRWECKIPSCKTVAFPKAVAEEGHPVLGKGDIRLIIMDDPDGAKGVDRYILCSSNNVMLDITSLVQTIGDDGSHLNLHVDDVQDSRKRTS